MKTDQQYIAQSNKRIAKRLKSAQGHLKKVLDMLEEEDRTCLQIAQQLYAVEKAIASSKHEFAASFMIYHLMYSAENNKDEAFINEIKEMIRYLS